jgi:hypothetical protein
VLVINHFSFLLVRKVFIEAPPPPIFLIILPIMIINSLHIVHLIVLLPLIVNFLLKLLVSHEVPHLACLFCSLLQILDLRCLLAV